MTEYVGRRGGAKPAPLSDRLWRKTRVGPGCWEWLGAKNDDGYPALWDGKRLTYAHRISYEMVIGPIPEGFEVDHTCGNRGCVNPSHLEAVTHRVNVQRAFVRSPGRMAGESHPRAKLTLAQVREIRSRPRARGAAGRWAQEFGVSIPTIWRILAGVGWKDEAA